MNSTQIEFDDCFAGGNTLKIIQIRVEHLQELIEAAPFRVLSKFQMLEYIDAFKSNSRELYLQLDLVVSLWIDNDCKVELEYLNLKSKLETI
jgi:hypothetical protein